MCKATERERELFHLLVLSPNAHNSQSWARPKLRAQNCIQVSRVGSRDKYFSLHLLPSRVCISRMLGLEAELGTQTDTNMGCWCPKQQLNLLHHSTCPAALLFPGLVLIFLASFFIPLCQAGRAPKVEMLILFPAEPRSGPAYPVAFHTVVTQSVTTLRGPPVC